MINATVVGKQNGIDKVTDWLEPKKGQLLTIRQFCAEHPWPSESALRAYIYRAEEMGIKEAFIRVNRRVLVEPKIFFTLIKQVENRYKQGDKYETMSCNKGAAHS